MWTATEQSKIKPGERPQRSETGNQNAVPESDIVKYLFTNHLSVPEWVEDASGRTSWQGRACHTVRSNGPSYL